jgi:hypothetical protein
MPPRSPLALSDAELEVRCRLRAWERPVWILELLIALGVTFGATLLVMSWMPGGRCLVMPVFPIAYLGLVRGIRALHEALPLAAHRRELAFRHWRAGLACWAPAGQLAAWSRRLLGEAGAKPHAFRDRDEVPEWLVVLQGAALPHGGKVCVRVSLCHGGAGSSVLVERTSHRVEAPASTSLSTRAIPRPLSSAEADEIAGLLVSFPEGFRSVHEGFVKDGFPSELVVARRDPPEDVALSFNLAAVADDVQDPAAVLARRLLALGRSDGGDVMIVGATDAHGNVTIGGV